MINFKNRCSRKDKRKRNFYSDDVMGDFCLAIDEMKLDNSTGDFNHLFSDFIEEKGTRRLEFRDFLQKFFDELQAEMQE